jgi:hypothetical protein
METKIVFGTYNVPSITTNLTASYTVPSNLPQEVSEKIDFSDMGIKIEENKPSFNDTLKAVLSVPKPR